MDTVMRMELGVSNVFFTPVGKKNKSLRIAAGGGGGGGGRSSVGRALDYW